MDQSSACLSALEAVRADTPDASEEVRRYLSRWCDSASRLPALLDLMERASPQVFWRCVAETWSDCDDTWPERKRALQMFRRNVAGRPPLDDLPPRLIVYRGCSWPRRRGLSWTTDQSVAAKFARGHRGIPVPLPVVVRGEVLRDAVFLSINDRNENELLIDPRRVMKLTSIEWQRSP